MLFAGGGGGYNAVISTSTEPELGIELRVGCITIAGNAQEGNQFIPLQEQIRRYHCVDPRIHLLDAKYTLVQISFFGSNILARV